MILKKDKSILRGAAPAFFVDFLGSVQNSFKI